MIQHIFIGADHAGFALKEALKQYLLDGGFMVTDLGNEELDAQDDYVDFAVLVAKNVASDPESCGILICNTGSGMSIAANKIPGIRAVNVWNEDIARYAREHNHANVLCLGERFLSWNEAQKITQKWVETNFSTEERHLRRVGKIDEIQREQKS
jgi:ribose 5-phosphate isomerase B